MLDEDININQMFEKLGVLLMLDAPEGLEFGIDNITWTTGNKFKGVKLIPLGTHIIAYSLKSENNMFKISRFLNFREDYRILVYRWNEQVSQFLQVRGQEGEGYRQGVKHFHFDSYLGPYPQENYSFWSKTTRYITKAVLDKLDPIDKIQQFQQEYSSKLKQEQIDLGALTLDDREDNEEENQQNQHHEQVQQKKQENPGKFKVLSDTIYYSQIPRVITANPTKITQINLDKTLILKRVLAKQWKNKQQNLLGQLQYSFIHFIIGQGEQSLSQWKKLVDLFVNSQTAYLRIQQLFKEINLQMLMMEFIAVFYDQLNQFPSDFFRDELSKGNFIVQIIKRLHQYSKEQDYSSKIRKRIDKLLQLVKTKFDFVIDSGDQDDQDKPILVNQHQSYF